MNRALVIALAEIFFRAFVIGVVVGIPVTLGPILLEGLVRGYPAP